MKLDLNCLVVGALIGTIFARVAHDCASNGCLPPRTPEIYIFSHIEGGSAVMLSLDYERLEIQCNVDEYPPQIIQTLSDQDPRNKVFVEEQIEHVEIARYQLGCLEA